MDDMDGRRGRSSRAKVGEAAHDAHSGLDNLAFRSDRGSNRVVSQVAHSAHRACCCGVEIRLQNTVPPSRTSPRAVEGRRRRHAVDGTPIRRSHVASGGAFSTSCWTVGALIQTFAAGRFAVVTPFPKRSGCRACAASCTC